MVGKTYKAVIAVLAGLALSACSTLSSVSDTLAENSQGTKVAVQFATLKTIEDSSDITADGVLVYVEEYRGKVQSEDTVSVDRLRQGVIESIGVEDMAMSDRLMLETLLDLAEGYVAEVPAPDVEPGVHRLRVLTVLDWIEQAAIMAGGS